MCIISNHLGNVSHYLCLENAWVFFPPKHNCKSNTLLSTFIPIIHHSLLLHTSELQHSLHSLHTTFKDPSDMKNFCSLPPFCSEIVYYLFSCRVPPWLHTHLKYFSWNWCSNIHILVFSIATSCRFAAHSMWVSPSNTSYSSILISINYTNHGLSSVFKSILGQSRKFPPLRKIFTWIRNLDRVVTVEARETWNLCCQVASELGCGRSRWQWQPVDGS